MNKRIKAAIVFIISFIISYLVVGYVKSNVGVAIHWINGVTVWDKLSEYYIRTFSIDIIPSLIAAIIATSIFSLTNRNRS